MNSTPLSSIAKKRWCPNIRENLKKGVSLSLIALGLALGVTTNVLAQSKTLNVAMIVWRGETEAERGFKDGLQELGYLANYTLINAGQDRAKLRSALDTEISKKLSAFDYIYTFGTTASKMTKFIVNNKVPQLFNIVTAPTASGIVKSMSDTGGAINGASQRVPIEIQIDSALKIVNIKKLGFLFNPREKNSELQRRALLAFAEQRNIEVVDLRSPPAAEVLQANLRKLVDKEIDVDAVYLPFDSFLISQAKLIGSRLKDGKIKSIGASKAYIENGALMGIVPDYYALGKAVASIVDRHQKGEQLHRIPVKEVASEREFKLVINQTTKTLLQVDVPERAMANALVLN